MVTPLSRRRPQVVAKHLTTLDHLSGGRAILGVGLGDPPDLDFSDFGDEPSYQVRAAITDEALTVLGGLLGDGRVSHHGDHLDVDASVRPLPVQRPRIPIWVAGRAPHTRPLARAKRWDGYVPIAEPVPLAGRPGGVRRRAPPRRVGPRRAVDARLHRRGVRGRRRHLADAVDLAVGGGLARRAARRWPRLRPREVPPLGVEPRLNRF